jgi:hypothetical protein
LIFDRAARDQEGQIPDSGLWGGVDELVVGEILHRGFGRSRIVPVELGKPNFTAAFGSS